MGIWEGNDPVVKCHFHHIISWVCVYDQHDLSLLMLTGWGQIVRFSTIRLHLSLFPCCILQKEATMCSPHLGSRDKLLLLVGWVYKLFGILRWDISLFFHLFICITYLCQHRSYISFVLWIIIPHYFLNFINLLLRLFQLWPLKALSINLPLDMPTPLFFKN